MRAVARIIGQRGRRARKIVRERLRSAICVPIRNDNNDCRIGLRGRERNRWISAISRRDVARADSIATGKSDDVAAEIFTATVVSCE